MTDFVDVHTMRRVVIEFLTAEGSSPGPLRNLYGEDTIDVNSDAGFVFLRSMKRTPVTGPRRLISHGSKDEDQKHG
jgi:hypothetical protein